MSKEFNTKYQTSQMFKPYDKKVLITLHLYKHDVPFTVRTKNTSGSGFTLRSPKDARRFIKDNEELIKLIMNYDDYNYDLTPEEKQTAAGMRKDLKHMLKKIMSKSFGSGFSYGDLEKDFYNAPITEFKKMIDS